MSDPVELSQRHAALVDARKNEKYALRADATDLGQRAVPASSDDRTFARMGPISNGISNLLAVGNLDRGWLVALVWTLGTKVEGEIKMLARFGTVFYWCGLAIAFACSIAATIILMAIIRGKLSGSEVWMAAEFFVAVGVVAVGVSRAVDSRL